jgi:hypothetical protein
VKEDSRVEEPAPEDRRETLPDQLDDTPDRDAGGVISLEEVEEVEDLQEVGDAEVADEFEEIGSAEEVGETHEAESAGWPEELSDAGVVSGSDKTVDAEEIIESDAKELEQLEAVQREILGPEAQMLEEIGELDELDEEKQDEAPAFMEPEEQLVNDIAAVEISQSGIPELEALTQIDYAEETSAKTAAETGERAVPAAPISSREGINREDDGAPNGEEIRRLIQKIDKGEAAPQWSELQRQFEGFLKSLGLTKGAVMLRTGSGLYEPIVACGLTTMTEQRLHFNGDERIIENVLSKNKILFIQNDAFVSGDLREKFDNQDSSTIRSMFFVPLSHGEGALPGFAIVNITTEEPVDAKIVTNKIKKIKKQLTNLI